MKLAALLVTLAATVFSTPVDTDTVPKTLVQRIGKMLADPKSFFHAGITTDYCQGNKSADRYGCFLGTKDDQRVYSAKQAQHVVDALKSDATLKLDPAQFLITSTVWYGNEGSQVFLGGLLPNAKSYNIHYGKQCNWREAQDPTLAPYKDLTLQKYEALAKPIDFWRALVPYRDPTERACTMFSFNGPAKKQDGKLPTPEQLKALVY
jgi:hypothetical protein